MPRPNPFSRKPNDDQSPETMMFPTDDTQMMDEPVPANADDADSTIIMPRVDDPPYHPQQMPTRRPQQQQPRSRIGGNLPFAQIAGQRVGYSDYRPLTTVAHC